MEVDYQTKRNINVKKYILEDCLLKNKYNLILF